jgi:hypothetical protein
MPRTTVEKIESIQTQIQQLENQKKQLMAQQKEQERKARTKRLIERGAILESLISGADALTNEQIKVFLEKTVQSETARKILGSMTSRSGSLAAAKPTAAAPDGGAPYTGKSASTEQEQG